MTDKQPIIAWIWTDYENAKLVLRKWKEDSLE